MRGLGVRGGFRGSEGVVLWMGRLRGNIFRSLEY